jgi:heme-degrading monooxygenase HmoA
MYIAMNRFRVAAGREDEFARHWRERKSYLGDTPGFINFKLLEGEHGEEETLFISHATWDSRDTFVAWTESEQFTRAHRQGRMPEGVVLSHPQFEGYEVVEERVS